MIKSMDDVNIGVVPAENVNGPYSMLTLNERLLAHDLGGDGRLLFIAQCLPSGMEKIRVFHQDTKRELGRFPAPSRGHIIPFKFRLKSYQPMGKDGSKGTIYFLDSVHPKIAGLYDALILKYEYEYTHGAGLKVNLLKEYSIRSNTIPFDEMMKGVLPNGAIYITGFDLIDDKYIVLTDCFAGAIWLFDVKTEALSFAFTGPDFLPKPWPEDLKITLPDGSIQDGFSGWTHKDRKELVPYLHQLPFTPGRPKMVPGLHGMTLYGKGAKRKVVFVSTAYAGIYSIDVSELIRLDIPPHEKKFETVVPHIRGVASWVGEVQDDRFNPGSPWIYFHRSLSKSSEPTESGYEKWNEKYNPLYRANMETGKVEFVAEDWKLWDLDSCLNAIPGKPGFIRLTSTPVQQHRVFGASGLITDPNDYSRLPQDFVFPVIDVKS